MSTLTTQTMDRLLFGDNQFFGVNHMSEEKARAQQMRFQDLNAVMGVLDGAIDKLVAFARSMPEARIWGGRTLFPDGTLNPSSCWRLPSW